MAPEHPAICMGGNLKDPNVVYLTSRARSRGFQVLELPEARLGLDWDYALHRGNADSGHIAIAAQRVATEEVAGFFVRLRTRRGTHGHPVAGVRDRLENDPGASLRQWLDSISGVVVNRPSAGRHCGRGDGQLAWLAEAGFEVPAVRHRYIPGKDVRVHTVADSTFATEIGSSGIGYQFHAETSAYRPRVLPDRLAELCCRVAARERLWLAAFDFRVTVTEEWVCVGMDQEPNFAACERSTGQPIADAILDLFEARCLASKELDASDVLMAAVA
ncbi:MAG: hypothetical protein ACRENP_13635 [Longimicrobiales bacterium]